MPASLPFQRQSPSLVIRENTSRELETSPMQEMQQEIRMLAGTVASIDSKTGTLVKQGEQLRIQLFGEPIAGETPHGRLPAAEREIADLEMRVRFLEKIHMESSGKQTGRKEISSRVWAGILLFVSLLSIAVGYLSRH